MMYDINIDEPTRQNWIAALRSGEYRQGQSRLIDMIAYPPTFCCLGVLCDVQGFKRRDDCGGEFVGPDGGRLIAFYSDLNVENDRDANDREDNRVTSILIRMNDSATNRSTFPQIADWIEQNTKAAL